jgi:hypothetical protein
MTPQELEEFAKAPASGFRCFAAGDESGPRFLARIRHALNPPAPPASVARIGEILGSHADQVVAFYRHHNGFVLYLDTRSDAAGIELFRVEDWEEATTDMRTWFEDVLHDPEKDPDHIFTGIAIATVPHSANYFVMPIEGPSAGKLFYADHDGWYESAFAEDFSGFLTRVTREPVKLLAEDLGCYTRYSDGETDSQWIPEAYFLDISRAQA